MNVSVPTSLLVRCLFTGESLAVAEFVDWITLETRQGWLRMLVCHTALYRLAVFTIRVVSVVVVATQAQSQQGMLVSMECSCNTAF